MLTPDFGMCQGRVLQTRKVSASYDRWVWRGDRVPRSKILLTQEEDLQTQIYSTCNLLSRRRLRHPFFSRVLSSLSRTPHIRATWFAGKSSFTE